MKQVQDALASTGIPAYAQMWQATAAYPLLPDQYYAYSSMTIEGSHSDDGVDEYITYLYLNLWSKGDYTEAIKKTRDAMYAAGWSMEEETTKGYKQPAYNEMVDMYCVMWTWVGREEVCRGD